MVRMFKGYTPDVNNRTVVQYAHANPPYIPLYATIIIGICGAIFLIVCIVCTCMRYCGKKNAPTLKKKVKYAELDESGEWWRGGLVQPGADDNPKYFGRIQYGLEYDFTEQQLIVGVHKCADLPSVDGGGGKSDPYVKVYISPDLRPVQETKHVADTSDPVFEDKFYFKVPYEEAGDKSVVFMVYDYNRFTKHAKISQCRIPLASMDFSRPTEDWCELDPPDADEKATNLGDVCLSLRYVPTSGDLKVVVIEAKNLYKSARRNSVVYVKLALLINGRKIKKKKTSSKKETVNPYFNEQFTFNIPAAQVQQATLRVRVSEYTGNLGKSYDIGEIQLSRHSEVSEVTHWNKALTDPGHAVAQWHTLHA